MSADPSVLETFFVKNVTTLVNQPSIAGLLYQCRSLTAELNAINSVEYPPEALVIRDVFRTIVDHIVDETTAMRDGNQRLKAKGYGGANRLRRLGRIVQKLNSYVTFLANSMPREAPPSVQQAMTELARATVVGDPPPVCLVIPQWEYNAECKPITNWLAEDIKKDVLDPDDNLHATDSWDLLRKLWLKSEAKRTESASDATAAPDTQVAQFTARPFPERVAVLSFARLDRSDSLMFPLLAHELGHFIDAKQIPTLHQDVFAEAAVPSAEVDTILSNHGLNTSFGPMWRQWLNEQLQICIRELLADLIAARILGFPFFAAQAEFLKSLLGWDRDIVSAVGYPGISFRLCVVLTHLMRPNYVGNVRSFLQRSISVYAADGDAVTAERARRNSWIATQLTVYLDTWKTRLHDVEYYRPAGGKDFQSRLLVAAAHAVLRVLPRIEEIAIEQVPDEKCAVLSDRFFERIDRIRRDLPPVAGARTQGDFAEILAAAWAYQMVYGEEREDELPKLDEQEREFQKLNRLVVKAIELLSAPIAAELTPSPAALATSGAGALSETELLYRLTMPPDDERHLDITPLGSGAIQGASIDLRLGNWFLIARRSRMGSVRVHHLGDRAILAAVGMEEIFVPFGHSIIAHPGDFMLGVTLEFLALPNDLTAFVEGRSSIGRSGLLVATAAPVAPTFHGVLVLELANTGTVPIEIAPGEAIAQLVLLTTSSAVKHATYHGQYYCQIKPAL